MRCDRFSTIDRQHAPYFDWRAADEALERMTSVMQREGAIGGITWGLRDVDHKTDGLQRGELTIVAGRPGMGKTGVGLGAL